MAWRIILRRLGKAGTLKERTVRQREWDRKYGEGHWEIGYVINGTFTPQDEVLETVYYRSYEEYFDSHPEVLEELIHLAKELRNPHSIATTTVDLQVPAIIDYLERHGLELRGTEVVDIGSWQGKASHPISVRLSPLQIPAAGNPKMTLEKFWQTKKCLAVWEE